MLSQKLQDAINEQISHEFFASHLYLSMSAYFESVNLAGCSAWMRMQSEEERGHALRLFDYLSDRGSRVLLKGMDGPAVEFESPVDAFQKALEHERKVTASIHQIYDLAIKESDYPTQVMLQWFVGEQVEEEKTAGDIVAQLEMVSSNPAALLMLDKELGARGNGESEA